MSNSRPSSPLPSRLEASALSPKRPLSPVPAGVISPRPDTHNGSRQNPGSVADTPKRKNEPLVYIISPAGSENHLPKPDAASNSNGVFSQNASRQSSNNKLPSFHSTANSSGHQSQAATGTGIAHFRFGKKINRLGLSRSMKSNVSFERILSGHWEEIDRIFYDKYHLHPIESNYFRPQANTKKKTQGKISDGLCEDVGAGVVKVCQDANRKRKKLRALCLKNPYLPCVYKNYVMVTSAMDNILSECFANEHQRYVWAPRISVLTFGILPAFVLLFLVVGILFGVLIGFLWDMVTFRYFLRFSSYEKKWIQTLCAENPELDGGAIDAFVRAELQKVCDTLMKNKPDCDLRTWAGVERFDHWNIVYETYHEFREEFFIIINPPSESYGQLLYHF